jgi:hypothetical protein
MCEFKKPLHLNYADDDEHVLICFDIVATFIFNALQVWLSFFLGLKENSCTRTLNRIF